MEKNLYYYLSKPLSKLQHSNFITTYELDDEMRLGLYYLSDIYNLKFYFCSLGSWEWVSLVREEGGKGLTEKEIVEMDADINKVTKHIKNIESGIFPTSDKNKKTEFDYTGKYGWLSPTADFYESGWGTHEEKAFEILQSLGKEDEWRIWKKHLDLDLGLAGDYLSSIGYVLIHSPSGDGYVVTHTKDFTKKQLEFLYDYFMAVGNVARASSYIQEGE